MAEPTKRDEFQPNWKHFHPYDTVWIQNPFDEVIEWQVADDNGVQHTYSVDAHARAELPGGMIATLGVKKIVDRMMQEDDQDIQLWNLEKRAEYEDKIIIRVKSVAPPEAKKGESQAINLTAKTSKKATKQSKEAKQQPPEPEFPQLDTEMAKATAGMPKTAQVE